MRKKERRDSEALKEMLVPLEEVNGKRGKGRKPNYIRTSKYTPWTFVPKCLAEQYTRPIFIYFIVFLHHQLPLKLLLFFELLSCPLSLHFLFKSQLFPLDFGDNRHSPFPRQLRHLALLLLRPDSCDDPDNAQRVFRRPKTTPCGQLRELQSL